MKFYLWAVLVGMLTLGSCVPNKKLVILQDQSLKRSQDQVYHHQLTKNQPECTLAIGDILVVEITYIDLLGASALRKTGGDINQAVTHEIDANGNIHLPLVGSVKIAGFTTEQAGKLIEEQAKTYYVQPSVKVSFKGIYLTVLGEVLRPGRYHISKCGTSVLELIGMAGGTTTMADLEEVKVVRTRGDSTEVYFIDLTNEELLESSQFYNFPDDVIYLKPLKRKAYTFQESQQIFRGIGIVLSVASLTIAISKL